MDRMSTQRMTVRDIMTRNVITVEPEYTLREVVDLLTVNRITGVPVVAGDQVVGVITMSDVLDFIASTPAVPAYQAEQVEWGELALNLDSEDRDEDVDSVGFFTEMWPDVGADVAERIAESEQPEWDLLAENTVSQLMTRKLITLPPGTSLRDAARHMIDHGVHRVLVVQGDKLEGIVSSTDLVRVLAGGKRGIGA